MPLFLIRILREFQAFPLCCSDVFRRLERSDSRRNTLIGEYRRRHIIRTAARPVRTVITTPGFNLLPSVLQRQEPMLIQAILPKPGIERLDKGVIRGLPGRLRRRTRVFPLRSNAVSHPAYENGGV